MRPLLTQYFWLLAYCALLFFLIQNANGAEPDVLRPEFEALRQRFEQQRDEIEAQRLSELRKLIMREMEIQQQRSRRAKISNNREMELDAGQAIAILNHALRGLEEQGDFTIPQKIRPTLTRMADLTRRALRSETQLRDEAIEKLASNYARQLSPLFERQGVKITDSGILEGWWRKIMELESFAPVNIETAGDHTADAVTLSGGEVLRLDGEQNVLDTFGNSETWTTVALFEVKSGAIEVITFPITEQSKTLVKEGRSLESGAPWSATMSPVKLLKTPEGGGDVAFRICAVEGADPISVADWPRRRNNWTLELRVRPSRLGKHAVILQTGAAGVHPLP